MNNLNQEKQSEKTGGLECRSCGCRHFRVESTRIANKQIIRYRLCRNCGKRLTTIERPVIK
ncbi:MAG: hypothetical protein A2Y10_08620 [Planctomycetes bacterium GWF2_41_51]|nr:MAG: hypothetical protein A2Y10_08620 [Planctomycetes bacterium GWF2_41_51]HBG28596.1 hypothetical protein [Phycisphaerales bacterium]